ncbi:toxin-antitoxin system YwqK family antitoxin [Listeria booriae]|uniref:toxin-antitoxin system YwqK family antitoxin n=1 Tax=Listeria booriae TaxID=1552123 RepID=UPI001626E57B|nr:hypothetical protein [Listeria booriae]MBC2103518.1 hypothetical protein [Listeria booriae]
MQNDILQIEEVLVNGVNFETDLDYGGEFGQGIVRYDENGEEVLYTGLAYSLYENGNIETYFWIEDGVKEGATVSFYKKGNIKSIGNMKKSSLYGNQYEYYENGKIKREFECVAGRVMRYIKFDEEGNVIDEKDTPNESDILYAQKFG